MSAIPTRTARLLTAVTACAGLLAAPGLTAAGTDGPVGAAPAARASFDEPYRPAIHFTPARNWMNDPNGLVYYQGEYHLFYQYNPFGNVWGHMSWGHAVSTDLIHWEELPVAIPDTPGEHIFSGSAVIDVHNTSGLGTRDNPPMIAVYTRTDKNTNIQSQAIAYSLDRGRTFTKFNGGKPVLDIGARDFRDPKVQWYEPSKSWLMTVSNSADHTVGFYSSKDLKSWKKLSTFGPAGATGGVWECPDLFQLPVDGDSGKTKWVLVVNINPGGIQGGSAAQYFIGDFDGTTFTAEDQQDYVPPAGRVVADFEGTDLTGWKLTGQAFGTAPAAGGLPEQNPVSNVAGKGVLNSFHGGNEATGTATSPAFTIQDSYVNFLLGGGDRPASEKDPVTVNLLVDGKVVRTATGTGSNALDWHSWDVSAFRGKQARIRAIDNSTGDFGHLVLDQVTMAAKPATSSAQRARWADYGKDYYAAVSWDGVPGGKRIMIGWMSNWEYAQVAPTNPWRSAQSIPRVMGLRTIGGRVTLTSEPVPQLASLHAGEAVRVGDLSVPPGSHRLPGRAAKGEVYELTATLDLRDARQAGFDVRTGQSQRTRIGYDARTQEIFIDRHRSGRDDFSGRFAGIHRAPLAARDGKVTLRVLVDTASVEVFANDGAVALTDTIFPDSSSTGIGTFSTGGTARVTDLSIQPLRGYRR